MEAHVTGDLEGKLTHSAAKHCRNPDKLVQVVLTSYFEEEARLFEILKRGDGALPRGGCLSDEQVVRSLPAPR